MRLSDVLIRRSIPWRARPSLALAALVALLGCASGDAGQQDGTGAGGVVLIGGAGGAPGQGGGGGSGLGGKGTGAVGGVGGSGGNLVAGQAGASAGKAGSPAVGGGGGGGGGGGKSGAAGMSGSSGLSGGSGGQAAQGGGGGQSAQGGGGTSGCAMPCGGGQICQSGACVCDPALPPGWPTWDLYPHNPVLVATSTAALQGQDNVYAPEIQKNNGLYLMWYGAQGGDGHDRIYFAWSTDAYSWQKWPTGAAPKPALDHGASSHVNDPSAVIVAGKYRVYYTDAATAEIDRVWLAEGTSPTALAKFGEVIPAGPAGAWDSEKTGRPAVLFENGVYRMWYDGTFSGARHVGYAESADGLTFTKSAKNPIFLNAGAVDVKRVGDVLVMLREAGTGTLWATSKDGLCWVDRGMLFAKSGAAYDAFGQVTPFLLVDGTPKAIFFGGAKVVSWDQNRIALAEPTGTTPPAAGCTGCVAPGLSCADACRTAGSFNAGSCGNPGSTSSGACCACATDGCEGCSGGITCQEACANAGASIGTCGNPGSVDPGKCCACQ